MSITPLPDKIIAAWPEIVKSGAFVFDIDETLMGPDDILTAYPKLTELLLSNLRAGLEIAVISGGPGSVVEDRLFIPLREAAKSVGGSNPFSHLTVYVNGGSSKFNVNSAGHLVEDEPYSSRTRIEFGHAEEIRKWIEGYVRNRFYLKDTDWKILVDGWLRKRGQQWDRTAIAFKDGWIRNQAWSLEFLEDEQMAAIKAGRAKGSTSSPFINTRRVIRSADGKCLGLAGFAITGFYALSQSKGDPVDLDLRDDLIERLFVECADLAGVLVLRKAGRSSIDVTKAGTDKAFALKDFMTAKSRNAALVYYFGDEFFPGGNDQPVADDNSIRESKANLIAVNSQLPPANSHVFWLGKSFKATQQLLATIANDQNAIPPQHPVSDK